MITVLKYLFCMYGSFRGLNVDDGWRHAQPLRLTVFPTDQCIDAPNDGSDREAATLRG